MYEEQLKKNLDALKKYQKDIQLRRDQWVNGMKNALVEILNDHRPVISEKCDIEIGDGIKNLDSVSLIMPSEPSGIEGRETEDGKKYTKIGGRLSFHQCINGMIAVTITLPYIEDLMEPTYPHEITFLKPTELKTGEVLINVINFIKKLKDWEEEQHSYLDDDGSMS